MCTKGSPSTTTAQNQVANTNTASNTQGEQTQGTFSQLGPNPDTLALYNNFLAGAGAIQGAPFDPSMMQQTVPWTAGQDAASNYQIQLGMQGMPYGSDAAALINQGAQSTVGQIPGVAASVLSPWAGQAVDYGQQQGQAISDYAKNLAAQGPQLQQFSQGAIDQYMSPYINDVVDATQNQFTNANAQQGNVLLGQGIKQGNAFGGDRTGMAAAQLANQQQLAQAPVIAGLYNTGYNSALNEFNQQNQLAAQLGQMAIQGQVAGGQLGMQGYGLGLNASTAANSLAAQALAQNQNAALQGGSMLGQLGGLQYSQNLAGGAQANQAAQIYPAYLQNLYGTQAANAQMANAYPFQTSSWYGGLLQGIGGLTGTQQSSVGSALSNYLQNQQGTQITNNTGTTTPPQPNSFLQAAGLGLAGLGLFAKRGGAVPRRAYGGGIPRRAMGGAQPAGRDINFLTGGFGDAIGIKPLQATHLAAPNTSATDIKLPTLSTLTFPGMSTQNPGAAASASPTGATAGLLGQATNILGNKQVASGIKSIGSSLFGNNDVSVAVSDGTGFGGGSPAGDLPTQAKRGGSIGYRSGGSVQMHYYDGGDVEDPDTQDIINNDFNALDSSNEGSPAPASANWIDSMISGMGLPNGDSDVPMPQSRPVEADGGVPLPPRKPAEAADTPPENEDPASWSAPKGTQGQPEAANIGLPELADDLPVPEAMTAEARGQPERQAGIGAARPQRGGGGGPRRIDFPGQQARPPGILERWASNPLTQLGLGLASARGSGLTGVAEGLAMGLNRVQAQKIANDKLDQNYKLDTSGKTLRVVYNNHAIDTTLPTRWADADQMEAGRQARAVRGRPPAGMQYNAKGRLEPVPLEGQQDPALRTAAAAAQSPGETGEIPGKAALIQGSISDVFKDETTLAQDGATSLEKLLQDPPAVAEPKRPEVLDQYPDVADQVKAISEGRMQAPTGSRKDKTATRIMEALPKYDPAYDQTVLSRRQKTANNFATGVEGRNIAAMNTFGQHLNEMDDIVLQMKNGEWPDITSARNYLARHAGALTPELKKTRALLGRYDEVSKALADEGAKVFAGQQSALADREEWHKVLPQANDAPDVAKHRLSQMVKLVDGRLQAVTVQYNNGMKTNHTPTDFISSKTRQVFDKIRSGGVEPAATESKAAGAPAAAPPKKQESHPDQIQNGILYQFDEATGKYKGVKRVQ